MPKNLGPWIHLTSLCNIDRAVAGYGQHLEVDCISFLRLVQGMRGVDWLYMEFC